MNKELIFMFVFIVSVLISSISQVLLKKSAGKTYATRISEYLNLPVIIAYGMFFSSTLITVFAYKYIPLSIGPILESTGYIFVSVLGYLFLKERLSKKKIIGMFLIIAGVILFALGGNA